MFPPQPLPTLTIPHLTPTHKLRNDFQKTNLTPDCSEKKTQGKSTTSFLQMKNRAHVEDIM